MVYKPELEHQERSGTHISEVDCTKLSMVSIYFGTYSVAYIHSGCTAYPSNIVFIFMLFPDMHDNVLSIHF